MHYPWTSIDSEQGPSWLEAADGGRSQRAFQRLLTSASGQEAEDAEAAASDPRFLRSVVYPSLNVAEAAWRELRRLNTTLVMRSVVEGQAAAEDFEDHMELLRTLRARAGRADDDSGSDAEAQETAGAAPNTDVLAPVAGGQEAVETLFGEGAPDCRQRDLVTWFLQQVRLADDPQRRTPPARVLLHGPGGCGKSVVIRALAALLRQEAHGVALAAPTGCAAYLIGGCTLHACLHLPVENLSYGRASDAPLPSGPALQHLVEYWRPVKVLIVDEASMVSSATLQRIDQRLQLYKRREGVPFGGLHVLLAGDLYQLQPVKGDPVYAAQTIWRHFSLCELAGNHRAAEDPRYAELLARLRVGSQTEEDVALLRSRLLPPPAGCVAVRLMATRRAVACINKDLFDAHAKHTGQSLHFSEAVDTDQETGRPVLPDEALDDAEDTGGLEAQTCFAVGAKVMLRRNLDISDGLVNGARGVVVAVHLAASGEVAAVDVDFEQAGRRWREEHGGAAAVRVEPATGGFMGRSGGRVLRRQVPLVLCYAMTIHKSQGATERGGAVVWLDRHCRQPCQAYVALSRVQRLEDLWLQALEPAAGTRAAGVEAALLQLQLQQAYDAGARAAPSPLWRQCFAPAESPEELERRLLEAPPAPWLERLGEELDGRAAEAAGAPGQYPCRHCGLALQTQLAAQKHQRRCALGSAARKKPAAAPSSALRRGGDVPAPKAKAASPSACLLGPLRPSAPAVAARLGATAAAPMMPKARAKTGRSLLQGLAPALGAASTPAVGGVSKAAPPAPKTSALIAPSQSAAASAAETSPPAPKAKAHGTASSLAEPAIASQ